MLTMMRRMFLGSLGKAWDGTKAVGRKTGNFFGNIIRRPFRPYGMPEPSTREAKDPLTALGLILLGGPLATMHFGFIEDVLRQTKAFLDSLAAGGGGERTIIKDDVKRKPPVWDGYRRRKSKGIMNEMQRFLMEGNARRRSIIDSFDIPEINPQETARRARDV